jgi:hypothetical protein
MGGVQMTFLRLCALGLVIVAGLSLAACCGRGTDTTVVTTPTTTSPTLGKELEDLEAAYKKGAISQAEYETAKKKKLLEQGAQTK